ncbi:MAG: acyltransferase family protein [Janthinobacterium lividum]
MRERIYGLDVWRAILLLGGPIVHAAWAAELITKYSGRFVSDLVYASSTFRMQCFFLIAGFLAAHGQAKQKEWLSRRILQLGVPLVFIWLVFLLPVEIVTSRFHEDGSLFQSFTPYNYHDPGHLWFLITLIAVSLLMAWVQISDIVDIDKINQINPYRLLSLALIAFVLLTAASLFLSSHIKRNAVFVLLTLSPTCVGAYIVGFSIERVPRVVETIKITKAAYFGPIAVVIATLVHNGLLISNNLSTFTTYWCACFISAVATSFMCLFVMQSALRITKRFRLVAILSDASYSIYVLHFPIIMLLGTYVGFRQLTIAPVFITLTVLSLGFSIAAHRLLIRRVALFAFLVNGKYRLAPRHRLSSASENLRT